MKISTPESEKFTFTDNETLKILLGEHDTHIKLIEKYFQARITVRGNDISVQGSIDAVRLTSSLLQQLYGIIQKKYPLSYLDIDYACRIMKEDPTESLDKIFLDTVLIPAKKHPITPKTIVQKHYINAIRHYDVVFAIGPAGTGKTYLAMAAAVSYLLDRQYNRIILTRPAVEAGEKLGFLPGDLAEKVNPYLRPLYDALFDMVDFDKAMQMINKSIIEVAPLAFMRGRTLNDSFVILDEAQNTTPEQMKMFLTRLGFGAKAVITGDVTQIDLPFEKKSGLVEAAKILNKIEGIKIINFSDRDVIRHPLVQDIIRAYNNLDHSASKQNNEKNISEIV